MVHADKQQQHHTFPVAPWETYSAPSLIAIWTWRRAIQGLAMAVDKPNLHSVYKRAYTFSLILITKND